MPPLFSIVLTTYNRSHFLPRAINSVLRQTFGEFELIIVDDCSSDHTPQLVAAFSHDKIKYIQQDHNQGVSATRNTGIQEAKGTYICFLDDDDEYRPNFLEEIVHFLKHKQHPFIGFIRVGIANVFTAGNLANGKAMVRNQIWYLNQEKNLLFITKMAYVGLIYHRSCFERAGLFNPALHFAEDLDLVLRMLEAGVGYASIPRVLINIHIHEQASLSRSIDTAAVIAALEHFLLAHDQFLHQHEPLWLYYYTSLARNYYHKGQKQLARRLVCSVFKKRWYHLKLWEMFFRFEWKL